MEDLTKWITMMQEGNDEGFQHIYDLFYKKAYYIALKISNYCEADAQDIVQDTFMEIHRSIKTLQDPKHFKSWMIKILISKGSHKFRDNRDLIVDPEKFTKMEGFVESRDYMLPSDKLNNEVEKQILLSLVDQLKPKQKEVLLLQYFEHFSIKEIAAILDIPEGTVKTRIMYAKEQLKILVNEYEKKEGRKLGFKADALGAALTLAFMREYESMVEKPKPLGTIKTKSAHTPFSWLSTFGIVACTATMIVMGAGILAELHTQSEQYEPAKVFEPTVYRNEVITNCRDAYYTLKEWAQNPMRMALRPQAEVMEIKPVYEALKKYDGVYYQKLIEDQWVQAFEARK